MTNLNEVKYKYGFWAFIPLLVFLLLFLGSGIIYTLKGTDSAFNQVPILAALLIGMIVAFAMNPKAKMDDKIQAFSNGISESGVILMVLIFMSAGAFSSVSKAMGGVDSVVNLGIHFIPSQFLVPGIFIIGCFISISTGTSVGTVVTMAPIAQGIAEATGISPAIAMGAVLGGAMFGDNLSIISDTTIAATKGVGAEMKDKFRMNFKIAIPAAIAAIIVFTFVSAGATDSVQAGAFSVIKVIPYLAVLIAAVAGMNVLTVLICGVLMSSVIGLAYGSLTFASMMQGIGNGMIGMASVAFLSLFIRGIIGITEMNGGIEWLVGKLSLHIKSRRGAEYSIALLVSLLAFTLLDNTVAILTAAPIAKTVGDQYGIAPKRMASLLDIFSCVTLCLAPHTGMIILLSTTASVSPLSILHVAFYQMFLGIAAIITVQFELMKTPEEKAAIKAAKAKKRMEKEA
jgi:Na+/H+ antiporter